MFKIGDKVIFNSSGKSVSTVRVKIEGHRDPVVPVITTGNVIGIISGIFSGGMYEVECPCILGEDINKNIYWVKECDLQGVR